MKRNKITVIKTSKKAHGDRDITKENRVQYRCCF